MKIPTKYEGGKDYHSEIKPLKESKPIEFVTEYEIDELITDWYDGIFDISELTTIINKIVLDKIKNTIA